MTLDIQHMDCIDYLKSIYVVSYLIQARGSVLVLYIYI